MTIKDQHKRNEVTKILALNVLVWIVLPLHYGCTTVSLPPPKSGSGTLWGYVTLQPPKGFNPFATSSAGYGDRRLRDVEFVDYRNPKFAVVYFAGSPPSSSTVEIRLIQTNFGPRFDKDYSAVGLNGTIIIRNEDRYGHVFSCKEAGLLRRLEPGQQVTIQALSAEEYTIFILDDVDIYALSYVVPGKFSLISENGRWELRDLPPGAGTVLAWHPGFPPSSQDVEVKFNSVHRVDLEIGVRDLPKIEKGIK